MPVFMPRERWSEWLDPASRDVHQLRALMEVAEPDAGVHAVPVSARVNVVANNGPELLVPIELGAPETLF